jgi:Holliday junction resolvasome RuvABC DNA-binding subunit
MTTMNATSIATYISKLETENIQLAAKVDKLAKDGLAIRLKLLEYEREFEIDDEESVCSNNLGLSYDSDETDDTYESEDEVSSYASTERTTMDSEDFDECYNHELVRALGALSYHEKDVHKSNAYAKAADAIYELKFKVDDGHELAIGDKKVPGIGKSIARLIDEFLETGKIKKLEQLAAVDETHDDYANTNEEVAYYLETLGQEETDAFKGKAYVKAANAIRALDFEVTHGNELADGPRKVPGIGKGIARKIDQFLQSC